MKISLLAVILVSCFALAACTEVPSATPSATAESWQPHALPTSPPPIPSMRYFFGLPPPSYPAEELEAAIYGEVVLTLSIDASGAIADWKIVSASSEGYAKEVERSFRSRRGEAKGVPAGTYSLCIAFCGDLDKSGDSRPGVFWVGHGNFGR